MIPTIRSGVLSLDEPAKTLVQEDEEAERKDRERELNRKNRDPEVRSCVYIIWWPIRALHHGKLSKHYQTSTLRCHNRVEINQTASDLSAVGWKMAKEL